MIALIFFGHRLGQLDKWWDVWLPGILMGIALGALFVGFMLIRIKLLRASENSSKVLEELEEVVEEEREGVDHDEAAG